MTSLGARVWAPYRAGLAGLDPRIRWIVAGTFATVAARMSLVTFLGIYFTTVKGLPIEVAGLGMLVENAARGLFSLPAGALSDRIGRRPVILACTAANAVILPMFLLVDSTSGVLLWSLAMGIAAAGLWPAASALILDLVPPGAAQRAMSVNYTALSLGFTLGVAPAGFLAERSYALLAVVGTLGYVAVVALYLTVLRGPFPREEAPKASPLRGMLRAPADPVFLGLVATCFVFPLGIGLVANAAPVWAEQGGLPLPLIGLIVSTNGILLALFAIPVAARIEPLGPFRLLGLAAGFLAVAYASMAFVDGAWGLLIGSTVFTFGELIFSSALPTAVAGLAPPGARGAYQGAWGLVFAASLGSALFLAGALADRIGWPRTWMLAAAFTALMGVVLLAARGRFRAASRARDSRA
jgi:MFS family permease